MFYIVDRRDRVAQQVSADAQAPTDNRFVLVEADGLKQAFAKAGIPNLADALKSLYDVQG